jgi:hypothetical protein
MCELEAWARHEGRRMDDSLQMLTKCHELLTAGKTNNLDIANRTTIISLLIVIVQQQIQQATVNRLMEEVYFYS